MVLLVEGYRSLDGFSGVFALCYLAYDLILCSEVLFSDLTHRVSPWAENCVSSEIKNFRQNLLRALIRICLLYSKGSNSFGCGFNLFYGDNSNCCTFWLHTLVHMSSRFWKMNQFGLFA